MVLFIPKKAICACALAAALVTLAAVVIAAFLALLGANLYYEKRM